MNKAFGEPGEAEAAPCPTNHAFGKEAFRSGEHRKLDASGRFDRSTPEEMKVGQDFRLWWFVGSLPKRAGDLHAGDLHTYHFEFGSLENSTKKSSPSRGYQKRLKNPFLISRVLEGHLAC